MTPVIYLKFDKKFLRCKLATLKADKFVVMKLKIETREDGKAVKMNCWFINYIIYVNIVKYKLDNMRKKMETEERDTSSRAKCVSCGNSLLTYRLTSYLTPCRESSGVNQWSIRLPYLTLIHQSQVHSQEDEAAMPKKDSRFYSWPSSMSKWRSSTICCG